eukprot:TRINITY_DN869_c0_g1_i3.p1 TRINITY_DN869_c0_g1~~TRINITY_DN869_c0_g1_i3.p1  ORF type:complete len:130 (+),score=17.22 TRINITY_DN869_c0_g1_i3:126-515(+)
MKTKSISCSLYLGDHVSNLLDSFHLLGQVFSLQEVTKMSITLATSCFVEVKQTLVDSFLQLKGSLHGLQRSPPLHAAWLRDILEDDSSSTLGLGRSSASSRAHALHQNAFVEIPLTKPVSGDVLVIVRL